MEYTFFIKLNKEFGWKYFRVNFTDSKFSILQNLLFSDNWTPIKIQEVISGISSTLSTSLKYEWANEDLHIAAFKEGVFLFDLLARRGGVVGNGLDLQLTHIEFIKFLEDFKKFVEENS